MENGWYRLDLAYPPEEAVPRGAIPLGAAPPALVGTGKGTELAPMGELPGEPGEPAGELPAEEPGLPAEEEPGLPAGDEPGLPAPWEEPELPAEGTPVGVTVTVAVMVTGAGQEQLEEAMGEFPKAEL